MRRFHLKKGSALLTSFVILSLIAVASVTYVNSATSVIRISNRQSIDVKATHLCEAGVQAVLRSLWRPFKSTQTFTAFDSSVSGASTGNPAAASSGAITGVGGYAAGVISVQTIDTYTRIITIRSVGWIDSNRDGALQSGEPQKVVDVIATFQLARSQVFDYAYFVNNYGWMDGFGVNDLVVNGDMRANGNFNFTNGSPTVNGSVYACSNDKLATPAAGIINTAPVKWSLSTYSTNSSANSANKADNELRWRQAYDSTIFGAKGTTSYDKWRDLVFESDGVVLNNHISGAVFADANGSRGWQRTSTSVTPNYATLDANPTREVIMPDLSDISYYQGLSASYVDTKANYSDGTANPNYGRGAYMQVWNSSMNAYQTVTTNGQITGSVTAVGTDAHPIIVHGPITVTQDCVIKGTVKGQGTVYTGRNVHVVGSIKYQTKPVFKGTNATAVDQANEKADMLGLAARASIILGDTTTFTNTTPLQYMTPPFTKGRYDENGNWIAPYNAKEVDSTGRMRYQSVISDSTLHSIAEGVNQVDAVMYTNFVGGGDVAASGSGVIFNGSIICKDEAMVCLSLPMRMNYDSRIRERSITQQPLIDIMLPRSPVMLRSAWQNRGFTWTGQ